MVLVRLAYAADLPTPDEAIRRLQAGGEGGAPRPPLGPGAGPASGPRGAISGGGAALRQPAAASSNQPSAMLGARPVPDSARPMPRTIEDLVALAAENRDIQLRIALERDVRLVRLEPGSLEFEPLPDASPQLAGLLMRRLTEWTGQRWMVAVATSGGAPTLRERGDSVARARRDELAADPVVARILELFPGSRIVEIEPEAPEAEPEPPAFEAPPIVDDEVVYAEERPADYGFSDDL